MRQAPEADALHLDRIVEIIELIRKSIAGIEEADFLANREKGNATALRLSPVGELSRKLSEELRSRHPHIPWRRMYSLRNIVAQHYDKLDYQLLWAVASLALDDLYAVCREELAEIDR